MTSLLASFSRLMTPELVSDIARAARLGGPQARKGLDIMGPMVLGSMARKSESSPGLASIMALLSPVNTPGDQVAEIAPPAEVLTAVLGPGASTLSKVIGGRLGFDVKPLLVAATPAILGAISQMAKQRRLDSADVAHSLQQEYASAMAEAASFGSMDSVTPAHSSRLAGTLKMTVSMTARVSSPVRPVPTAYTDPHP